MPRIQRKNHKAQLYCLLPQGSAIIFPGTNPYLTTDSRSSLHKVGKDLLREVKRVAGEKATAINFASKLPNPVQVLAVLCPLYGHGPLRSSALLEAPSIAESRVGGKMTAYAAVLGAMADRLSSSGLELKPTFLFADRGVLLPLPPSEEDIKRLRLHSSTYIAEIDKVAKAHAMRYVYEAFSGIGLNVPGFVDTSSETPSPESPSDAISIINEHLATSGSSLRVKDNSRTRGNVVQLLTNKGLPPPAILRLTANYLIFQESIPSIVGKEGIFLQAERFVPFLKIPNLIEELRTLVRIDLEA